MRLAEWRVRARPRQEVDIPDLRRSDPIRGANITPRTLCSLLAPPAVPAEARSMRARVRVRCVVAGHAGDNAGGGTADYARAV